MTEMVPSKKTKHIRKAILKLSLRLLFVCFLCIVFLSGRYFIPQILTYEYSSEDSASQKQEAYNQPDKNEAELCTLRLYNGKIGVFTADGELLEVVDIDVKALPEYDIALLREGIVAQENEIMEICEGLVS